MTWLLVYGVLGLLSVLVLGLLLLRVWRSVKALGAQVAAAGAQVAGVTDALAAVQDRRAPG